MRIQQAPSAQSHSPTDLQATPRQERPRGGQTSSEGRTSHHEEASVPGAEVGRVQSMWGRSRCAPACVSGEGQHLCTMLALGQRPRRLHAGLGVKGLGGGCGGNAAACSSSSPPATLGECAPDSTAHSLQKSSLVTGPGPGFPQPGQQCGCTGQAQGFQMHPDCQPRPGDGPVCTTVTRLPGGSTKAPEC